MEKKENEKFCASCGAAILKEAEICPKCGVRQAPPKSAVSQEGADGFLKFLTFLFPVIGLVLYFVWMDSRPRAAKEVGKWAIISVVTMAIVIVVIIIAIAVIAANIAS